MKETIFRLIFLLSDRWQVVHLNNRVAYLLITFDRAFQVLQIACMFNNK